MAEIVFWSGFGAIVFAYAGYSVLMVIMGTIVNRRVRREDITPSVTFLITAYNEEIDIARKIEQTLGLDYPPDKMEILVASDGSTDGTDEIVQGYSDRGVRLLRVEGRVGKTATQNEAVRHANNEIIVFSDATTLYESDAVRKLVRNYADDTVGAVSGRYEYRDPKGASTGLGTILFWKYENLVKEMQTRVHTITGCCGCIYSVRKSLYVPLPADIISDLVQPLKIVEQRYRIVFEKEAVAYEETTEDATEEFSMRVRVITRGMRGMLYMRSLFNPFRHPLVSLQILGHKVARWLVPVFGIAMLISSATLLSLPFYRYAFLLMLLVLVMAALGAYAERRGRCPLVLRLPLYFVVVNLAAIAAMWKVAVGEKAVTWETVRR
jgi:cellulose synthase/poly-beta-1,6-N-acetylglucosamine synthase-like glycosyltransferase